MRALSDSKAASSFASTVACFVLLARCYVQPTDPDATAAAPREEKSDETAQG